MYVYVCSHVSVCVCVCVCMRSYVHKCVFDMCIVVMIEYLYNHSPYVTLSELEFNLNCYGSEI